MLLLSVNCKDNYIVSLIVKPTFARKYVDEKRISALGPFKQDTPLKEFLLNESKLYGCWKMTLEGDKQLTACGNIETYDMLVKNLISKKVK